MRNDTRSAVLAESTVAAEACWRPCRSHERPGKASRIARLSARVLARRPQHPRLHLHLRLRLRLRQRQRQRLCQHQHNLPNKALGCIPPTLHSSPQPTGGATRMFTARVGITSSRRRARRKNRHRRHHRPRQIRSSSSPPSSRPWIRRLVWAHCLQRCMSRLDESWHDGPNNAQCRTVRGSAHLRVPGGSRSVLLGAGAHARVVL